jgi:hypothetical protein
LIGHILVSVSAKDNDVDRVLGLSNSVLEGHPKALIPIAVLPLIEKKESLFVVETGISM